MDRRSGTRYPFSFMVPLLYDDAGKTDRLTYGYYLDDPERKELESAYLENVNSDINRLKPELVMILFFENCFDCPDGLSMSEYVYGKKRFFDFLDDYENVDPAEGFIILKRTDQR